MWADCSWGGVSLLAQSTLRYTKRQPIRLTPALSGESSQANCSAGGAFTSGILARSEYLDVTIGVSRLCPSPTHHRYFLQQSGETVSPLWIISFDYLVRLLVGPGHC